MKSIYRSYLAAGAAAAAVGIAGSAHATLQLAFDINGIPFGCVDNNPICDSNPAVGTIQLNNDTFAGVQVNGSIQVSTGTPGSPGMDSLNTSSLSIINTNGVPVTGTAAISDTSFTAPVNSWTDSGSGTFQFARLTGTTTFNWFIDPANAQGAGTPTDTPGTLVDTFSDTATRVVDSFSRTNTGTMVLTAPFSLTEQFTLSLPAGGQLISRGQTIVLTSVPEPSTWVMMALGFVGLGYAAVRRSSKDRSALAI